MSTAMIRLIDGNSTQNKALALMEVPFQEARRELMRMPVVHRLAVIGANIGGGGSAPLILALPPREAVRAMTLDAGMFDQLRSWASMLRRFGVESATRTAESWNALTVRVRMPNGTFEHLPVDVNPDRLMTYFQTVIAAEDADWREETLRQMNAPLVLAYLMSAANAGIAEFEIADLFAIVEYCGHDIRDDAEELMRRMTVDGLAADLVDLHVRSARLAYRPKKTVGDEHAKKTASDLLAGLDLGDE